MGTYFGGDGGKRKIGGGERRVSYVNVHPTVRVLMLLMLLEVAHPILTMLPQVGPDLAPEEPRRLDLV